MEVRLEIVGATPLVMHNPRLADKEDPFQRAMGALTSKTKKTDDDNSEIAHIEFLGSLYWESDIGLYLPTWNIVACLLRGATLFKLGKALQRGVAQTSINTPIVHDGPKTPEELWQREEYRFRKVVANKMNRVMRMRPIFRKWGATVDLLVAEESVSPEDFARVVATAGRTEGLGDARKLGYGRFAATITEGVAA